MGTKEQAYTLGFKQEVRTYRIYADGGVIGEESFGEYDGAHPYYDDYQTVEVPAEVVDFILDI